MGRSPCCSKEGLNRGAWTAREDKILIDYIKTHGEGLWRSLPKKAGLKRCGKSCRLRWLNYLRPDIKRGNISDDEEELIIRLHKLLGNRWSLIAGRLPGRTDNEIKNYWNTNLAKKVQKANSVQIGRLQGSNQSKDKEEKSGTNPSPASDKAKAAKAESRVIRTKATRCSKVFLSENLNDDNASLPRVASDSVNQEQTEQPSCQSTSQQDDFMNILMDLDIDDICITDFLDSEFLQHCGSEIQDNENGGSAENNVNKFDNTNNTNNTNIIINNNNGYNCLSSSSSPDQSIFFHDNQLEEWPGDDCFLAGVASELQSLASLLDSNEDWL